MIETLEKNQLTAQQVADKVRPYFINRSVGDISLQLDEVRITQRNGYWRIPVRPSYWPEPLFPYYDALALLEDEIQNREGIKITLASGDPVNEE